MKDLRWPHVIMVLGALGVLGWLTYEGKDGATVIAGALALLGALGYVAHQQGEIKSQTEAIKQQTNGTNTELLRQLENKDRTIKQMADKMAEMTPPPSGSGESAGVE